MIIEIKGIEQTRKFLKFKSKKIKLGEQIGLKKSALIVQGEVKSSIAGQRAEPTSVDTGRFLNSIEFKTTKDNAIVFTPLKYAKYLEYGTSRILARKHFQNSANRMRNKIKLILEKSINI